MEVSNKEASKVYKLLKNLKVSSIDKEEVLNSIWDNMKALRPIANEYDKSIEDMQNSLQDEAYKIMQDKLQKAIKIEDDIKNNKYVPTKDDHELIKEVNEYFTAYSNKVNVFVSKEGEKKQEVILHPIADKDMLAVLKANNKTFDDMLELSIIIDEEH